MSRSYLQRTCYVNFAEHLQNSWNVNFIYENAPCQWSDDDWTAFFAEISAFGYTNFMFWIPPTICKKGAMRERAVPAVRRVMELCHAAGLTFNPLIAVNTIGAEWFFACPNLPSERRMILEFWQFWIRALAEADIFSIFPGDPGGCRRNGCDHRTFLTLSAEIAAMVKSVNPRAAVDVGTWGTPFTGWGEDMRETPNWDGTWAMLTDPDNATPEVPCHIWNGSPERVAVCMNDLLASIDDFPADTAFSINSGFNPDCEPKGAYDGRPWAAAVSKTRRVLSWDYAASEGELVCYPHFRVGKYRRKRQLEMESTDYTGAICYTMSPRLSKLMLYCACRTMIDPDADPMALAAEFTEKVFGDPAIGPLMEAFEIVPGWGYEKTVHDRTELKAMFAELIARLEAADCEKCTLPIFGGAAAYRDDLLWHARSFLEMLGDHPDRVRIRREYWEKAMAIYDTIPQAADERSRLSADKYCRIGEDL